MRLKVFALLVTAAVLGLLAWRARPARIVDARVTATAPGAPPIAHVSLTYGRGLPPAAVIVDVSDEAGAVLGSATVPGGRMLLELPVMRTARGYHVAATAYHRLPWGVRELRLETERAQ